MEIICRASQLSMVTKTLMLSLATHDKDKPFIHLFIILFIYSFIYLFIYLFIHVNRVLN